GDSCGGGEEAERGNRDLGFAQELQQERDEPDHHETEAAHTDPRDEWSERTLGLAQGDPTPRESAVWPGADEGFACRPESSDDDRQQSDPPQGGGPDVRDPA